MTTRTNRIAFLAVVAVATLTMATSAFADGRRHRSHDDGQYARHRTIYSVSGHHGAPYRSFQYGRNHEYRYYGRGHRSGGRGGYGGRGGHGGYGGYGGYGGSGGYAYGGYGQGGFTVRFSYGSRSRCSSDGYRGQRGHGRHRSHRGRRR